jgi:hypothetical protein
LRLHGHANAHPGLQRACGSIRLSSWLAVACRKQALTFVQHALRILMDWPLFLRISEEPQAAQLAQIGKESASSAVERLNVLLGQVVFGEDPDRWCPRTTLRDLREWTLQGQAVGQRLVRQLFDEGLLAAGAVQVSTLPKLQTASLAERRGRCRPVHCEA